MHAVVVYESMYGNTHTIAECLGDGLRPAFDTTVVAVSEATTELLEHAELVVVGGPTHVHSLSRAATRKAAIDAARSKALQVDASAGGPGLRDWFPTLRPRDHATAVAFDTRVRRPVSMTGRAARGITQRLRRSGFREIRDAGSFFVDKNNELLPGEAERAVAWARAFADRL
jgi:Flavodoxin